MSRFIQAAALTVFALLFFTSYTQAQENPPSYKDIVGDNPTPEADMQVVINYAEWLVGGEAEKVKSILADDFMAYGPGPSDSLTTEQLITNWKRNYELQSNRKVTHITSTWRVLGGSLKGDWVSMWGTYTYTQSGKDLSLPFQLTASLTDEGKLSSSIIYYDQLPIAMALGYTLTPPKAEEGAGGN